MTAAEILAAAAAVISLVTLICVIVIGFKLKGLGGVQKRDVDELSYKVQAVSDSVAGVETRLNGRLAQGEAATEARLNGMRDKLDADLKYIADTNTVNLEKIRLTVDEKFTATLDGKLGENYARINERLDAVAKGIGEVNSLAGNVSDIKRLFSNVKLRGTWGEVQLATLLEQMLSPSQYVSSFKLNPDTNEMVDFAVKIPSKDDDIIYLPIDSKFPVEEYIKLADAADRESADRAAKNLERAVKLQADSIAKKYIVPPYTTDFAVMYLPLEGLYAEIIKMPQLEGYARQKRIMVCGPTNLGALLSSLQTGFRTVAIEKRSGELWQTLSAFKAEFEKFALALQKTQKKLQEAQNELDNAGKKTAAIGRKLRGVADIGGDEADNLLAFNSGEE